MGYVGFRDITQVMENIMKPSRVRQSNDGFQQSLVKSLGLKIRFLNRHRSGAQMYVKMCRPVWDLACHWGSSSKGGLLACCHGKAARLGLLPVSGRFGRDSCVWMGDRRD